MTARETKIRRQLTALRNMTVENGCPAPEAATAQRFADELEAELTSLRGRHAAKRATRSQIDAILRWRPGEPLPNLGDILAVLDDDSIVDEAPEKSSHKLSAQELTLRDMVWRGERCYYRNVRCSDCERRPPVWGCSDEEWRCTPCARKAGYPTKPRTCKQCGAEERVRHGLFSNLSPYSSICTDCLNKR